jgi:pyruvate formate lyase activating enzyme
LPYTDLFLYDLKMMDDKKHRQFTGVSNRLILENLQYLTKTGTKVNIRIPIIPNINDDEKNLNATATFIATLKNIQQVDLLPYHNIATDKYHRMAHEYLLEKVKTPSKEKMQELAEIFLEKGFQVNIGG